MYFGNSKNTLSPKKLSSIDSVPPTESNYVVAFIDEAEANYTLDLNGEEKGICWDKDVESYLRDTENIPNDGGINNFIVFDLLNWPAPIWPQSDDSAKSPPLRDGHIVEIERPSVDDEGSQVLFFSQVISDLEARWTEGFWDIIRENDRKFVIIVDDSGSMRYTTIQGAINLLVAYAESKGIPTESIIVLQSCTGERWLKWGAAGLVVRSDIGCEGTCETTNIQFCTWECTAPTNSDCYQNSITFGIPKVVYKCDDPNMEDPIEYSCTTHMTCDDSPNRIGAPYFWIRIQPSYDEGCSLHPNCTDSLTGNQVGEDEVWSPGWWNTTSRIILCGSGSAGEEAGNSIGTIPGQILPPCQTCITTGGASLSAPCGCTNPLDFPSPCGSTGTTTQPFTFYKCVNCVYPNDTWDGETWPPPSGEFGGEGFELCRMADCSFTAGTDFGTANSESPFGWTGGTADFFGCAGYFLEYKDSNGNCIPCRSTHPVNGHPLYKIEGCTEGCTNCAKESGFSGPEYEYLWVEPWNRCGIDCN